MMELQLHYLILFIFLLLTLELNGAFSKKRILLKFKLLLELCLSFADSPL